MSKTVLETYDDILIQYFDILNEIRTRNGGISVNDHKETCYYLCGRHLKDMLKIYDNILFKMEGLDEDSEEWDTLFSHCDSILRYMLYKPL